MSNDSPYARRAKNSRGGTNRHAQSYADMVVAIDAAGQILQQPYSVVRQRALDGDLPVHHWVGQTPYFRAGDLMALNPS